MFIEWVEVLSVPKVVYVNGIVHNGKNIWIFGLMTCLIKLALNKVS